jgi:hypothetical protein
MTLSKISALWPRAGGSFTDGRFDSWTGDSPDSWTASPAARVTKESTEVKTGTYSAKITTTATGQGGQIYQDIDFSSEEADMSGFRLSVVGWVKAGYPGGYLFISTVSGEILAQKQHPGTSDWQRLHCTAIIPSGYTRIRAGFRWYPSVGDIAAYVGGLSCLRGDTPSEILIEGKNVFPVSLPEMVLSSSGYTADGEIFGIGDGVVVVDRIFRFEGVDGDFYRQLRDFYRYVAVGMTYEVTYTDDDGNEYQARMMSFQDAEMIGSDLYNFSITLRLKDIGIL